MARLIVGAGYGGWILFLDEVELIGRYTLLQRAKSYAELARWMGIVEGSEIPPLVAVASITDDFVPAVLDYHNDPDVIGPRLRDKGTDEYFALAARAEGGMRFLKRNALRLQRPTVDTLASTYDRLKLIHGGAYGWAPPDLLWDHVVPAKWSMRSYVRRWMNEWDLKRLYPGSDVETEEVELRPSYEEDLDLESAEETDSSRAEEIELPIRFKDRRQEGESDYLGYLRFVDEEGSRGIRAGLFLVNSIGEPVDFSFSRIDVASPMLWARDGSRRRAVGDLCRALFAAAAHQPAALLGLAIEIPPGLLGDELQLSIPVCRIAMGETRPIAAYESAEHLSDDLDLYWVGELPEAGSPARVLIDGLATRGALLEPFDRVAAGLDEAYKTS